MTASGDRSSCEASETNWRWLRWEASIRSSISLRVSARRAISSSPPGVGQPSVGVRGGDPWTASRRIDSTGRSARPTATHTATAEEEDGRRDGRRAAAARAVRRARDTCSSEWATTTRSPGPARSATTAYDSSSSPTSTAGRDPGRRSRSGLGEPRMVGAEDRPPSVPTTWVMTSSRAVVAACWGVLPPASWASIVSTCCRADSTSERSRSRCRDVTNSEGTERLRRPGPRAPRRT